MVQLPPGGTAVLQVLLGIEKALAPPLARLRDVMLRLALPVLVRVVVRDEFKLGNFSAPLFTISLWTVPFRSAT